MIKSDGSDNKGLSQEQLEAISAQISALAEQRFVNLNLSADLMKAVQMLLLGKSVPQDPAEITEEYIETTLFPRAVEGVFRNYQKTCYHICLEKTQDRDLSEDMAQEAIKLLLLSENRVNSISAWLARVTYNLLNRHFKNSEKEAQLYKQLSLEAGSYEKWLESGGPLELKELDADMAEELQKSEEYRQYHEIDSYENIQDYADKHNISVEIAQRRKERAHRNLNSKILRSLGWRESPRILDYHQYNAIQKFIREVQRMCSGDEKVKWLKSLSPEHAEDVRRVKSILDWGIAAKGGYNYDLHIFAIHHDGQLFAITFDIVLNERNSISIQDYKINEYVNSHTIPDTVRIHKDKGRSIWTYEDIISMLKRGR
jgi:DNA-directed RNA polymerase specialized sigma24 family protein